MPPIRSVGRSSTPAASTTHCRSTPTLFGWSVKTTPMGDGQPDYNEFQIGGQSVAGAWEMNPGVPAEVPSYWQVYFAVDDVDAAFRKALDLGASEVFAPTDYPGGRFGIVTDPQGASFGLLKTSR